MQDINVNDPVGRPSKFTPGLGELICALIAEGKSLNSICATVDGMPYIGTVLRWVLDGEVEKTEDLKNFAISYKRAMEIRTEILFDQVVDIADHKGNDFKTDAHGVLIFDDAGNPMIDHDNIQRAKLQIDTRLKYAGKMKPKKYGDKITNEVVGDPDKPLDIRTITIELIKPKE